MVNDMNKKNKVKKYVYNIKKAALPVTGSKTWVSMMNSKPYFNSVTRRYFGPYRNGSIIKNDSPLFTDYRGAYNTDLARNAPSLVTPLEYPKGADDYSGNFNIWRNLQNQTGTYDPVTLSRRPDFDGKPIDWDTINNLDPETASRAMNATIKFLRETPWKRSIRTPRDPLSPIVDWRADLEKSVYDKISEKAKNYASNRANGGNFTDLTNSIVDDLRDYELQLQLGMLGQRGQQAMRYGAAHIPVPSNRQQEYTDYMMSVPMHNIRGNDLLAYFSPSYHPTQVLINGQYTPNSTFKGKGSTKFNKQLKGADPTTFELQRMFSPMGMMGEGAVMPSGPSFTLPVEMLPAAVLHEMGHAISNSHPLGGLYMGNTPGTSYVLNSLGTIVHPNLSAEALSNARKFEEIAADNLAMALANSRYSNIPHFKLLQEQLRSTLPLQYASYKDNSQMDAALAAAKGLGSEVRIPTLDEAIAEGMPEAILMKLNKTNANRARNALIYKDIINAEKANGFVPSPLIHGLVNPTHLKSRAAKKIREDIINGLEAQLPNMLALMKSPEAREIVSKNFARQYDPFSSITGIQDNIDRYGLNAVAEPVMKAMRYTGTLKTRSARKALHDAGLTKEEIKQILTALKEKRKAEGAPMHAFMDTYATPEAQRRLSKKMQAATDFYGKYPENNNWNSEPIPGGSPFKYSDSGYTFGDKDGLFEQAYNIFRQQQPDSIYAGYGLGDLTGPNVLPPVNPNGQPWSIYM